MISEEHGRMLWDGVKFLLGTLVGAAITKRFDGEPELISHWGHVSAFSAKFGDQPTVIHSHEVVVRNSGRKPAMNVRVHHQVLPDQFNIAPSVPYSIDTLPDGTKDIVFNCIVPKQQLTISYLYFPPLTVDNVNAGIRSDSGFARPVEMELSEKTPRWAIVLVSVFMVIGIAASLYVLWMIASRYGF